MRRERSIGVAALVARDETSFDRLTENSRWSRKDGVWLLRTTRQWIVRDLDLLKPIFERMRVQGFDLLDRNAVLADELRRTFPEIDRIERELGKAGEGDPVHIGARRAIPGAFARSLRRRFERQDRPCARTGWQCS